MWGIFKKVFIANSLAMYVDSIYAAPQEKYGVAILVAVLFFPFQLYADFSAYSDMAIGVSKFLGFDVGINFNHPFLSKSCGELWKRWHISLSLWLKDYIYIPLGGSRVSTPRIYLNLIITFLVSGIWHGAAWTFVIWGLLHGLFLCFGRLLKPVNEKLPDWLRIVITFCLFSFAAIFFRAATVNDGFIIMKKILYAPIEFIKMFPVLRADIGVKDAIKTLFSMNTSTIRIKWMFFTSFYLLCFIVIDICTAKKSGLEIIRSKPAAVRWALYYAVIIILIFSILDNTAQMNADFIYLRF